MRSKIDITERARIELARVIVDILPSVKRQCTQQELARLTGLTQGAISQASVGCGTFGTYVAIATALRLHFTVTIDNDGVAVSVESAKFYRKRYNEGGIKFPTEPFVVGGIGVQ